MRAAEVSPVVEPDEEADIEEADTGRLAVLDCRDSPLAVLKIFFFAIEVFDIALDCMFASDLVRSDNSESVAWGIILITITFFSAMWACFKLFFKLGAKHSRPLVCIGFLARIALQDGTTIRIMTVILGAYNPDDSWHKANLVMSVILCMLSSTVGCGCCFHCLPGYEYARSLLFTMCSFIGLCALGVAGVILLADPSVSKSSEDCFEVCRFIQGWVSAFYSYSMLFAVAGLVAEFRD